MSRLPMFSLMVGLVVLALTLAPKLPETMNACAVVSESNQRAESVQPSDGREFVAGLIGDIKSVEFATVLLPWRRCVSSVTSDVGGKLLVALETMRDNGVPVSDVNLVTKALAVAERVGLVGDDSEATIVRGVANMTVRVNSATWPTVPVRVPEAQANISF